MALTSSIQYNTIQSNIDNTVFGCNVNLDPCDAIRDSVTYPYQNMDQTAVFHGLYRQDGLMKTLGMFVNMMNINDFGVQSSTNQGLSYQYNLPSNNGLFTGNSGPRVIEMPLTAGNQIQRTGFTMEVPSDTERTSFFVTDDLITASNAGGANAANTYIMANENRLVLPGRLALFGTDDEFMGCDPRCCGEGFRKWYIFDKNGNQETVHVSNKLPMGVTDARPYGKLANGTVAVYMIRGVGQDPKPGSGQFTPSDYGSALRLYKGTEIKIGTIVPITDCLPCPSPYRAEHMRKEFTNTAERMVDEIYCVKQSDFYTQTYHEEPNRMKNSFMRNFGAAQTRMFNTLMYGQKMAFAGSDYVGAVVNRSSSTDPVQGLLTNGKVPHQTDGLVTLWNKYARKLNLVIADGCDNRCLFDQLKYMIQIVAGEEKYKTGNWVFVGDDYLFQYMNELIVSKVVPNTYSEASNLIQGSNSMIFGNTAFSMNNESLIPGFNNNIFSFQSLNIGGRKIPFIKDMEMKLREPGVMYLINLDAVEFWHPNRQLDIANGFIPSTVKAGSILPSIITNKIMQEVNGQFAGYAGNNCPYKVWSYAQLGAWYTPSALPQTFKITMKGMKKIGTVETIVPLSEIACGCYNTDSAIYNQLYL